MFTHDAKGRLVSSTPEVEWDEQQQALLLALGAYRAQIHPQCGGYLPDTTDPAAEEKYSADDPTRCHLCTAQLVAIERYRESPQAAALLFGVEMK